MAFDDNSIGVLFKIRGDSSDARRDIRDLRGAVKSELQSITASFTDSMGAAGRLAGALGPVAIGATVVGSAALAAGGAIFTLAKNAADAGSQIYDLSRNTGISATLLSSLKVAADQSGASIQEVAQGISLFNRLIGEANQGSKEATETLKRFGIDPQEALKNSEAAFAQVVKRINELPPGIERANAAREAFGRGGASLVSTLEAVGGNLDVFIERMKALGVVFDDEGARAADEFGDTLDELGVAARGLAQTVGREAIPEITLALRELGGALQTNRSEFGTWAGEIGNLLRATRLSLKAFIQTYRDLNPDLLISPAGPIQLIRNLGKVKDEDANRDVIRLGDPVKGRSAESEAFLQQQLRAAGRGRTTEFASPREKKKKASGGKSAADAARREALAILKVQGDEEELEVKRQTATLDREYKTRIVSIDDYAKQALATEKKRFEGVRDLLLKERATVEPTKQREIDFRLRKEQDDFEENNRKIDIQKNERRIELVRETNQRLLDIAEIHDQAALARISAASEAQTVTFEKAEAARQAIEVAAFTRRREALELEIDATKDLAEAREEVQAKIAKLEAEAAAFKEGAPRRTAEALRKDIDNERAFSISLEALRSANLSGALENAAARLAILARQTSNRRGVIAAQADLEQQAEKDRHKQALDAITEDQRIAELGLAALKASEEKKAALREEFRVRREIEDERSAATRAEIERREREEQERSDPTSARSIIGEGFADNLASIQAAAAATGNSISDLQAKMQAGVQTATDFFGKLAQDGTTVSNILGDSFKNITNALGATVSQYVLLGKTGPAVLRRILAEELAAIAAKATIKAIEFGAYALGLAALGNFAGAAQAGAAALMWGSIAAGSAIAGRVTAGSLFQQDARGASGAPNQSRLAEEDRPQPRTIVEHRQQAQPVQVNLKVDVKRDAGSIVDVFVDDYARDGRTRSLIRSEGFA